VTGKGEEGRGKEGIKGTGKEGSMGREER